MERLNESEQILQIDCNNPVVDACVVTRFESNDSPFSVTGVGEGFAADDKDNVPFGCPLTTDPDSVERLAEDFSRSCCDCPHAFISFLHGAVELDI